jgi:uncharacterized protein
MRKIGIIVVCLWLHSAAYAQIMVGKAIPKLEILSLGELMLNDDKVTYQQWSTDSLADNKVHTLQYLAGRMSASEINSPFTDELQERDFSDESHHVTTIVNLSDSFFGTSGLVASELNNKKKIYPLSSMVADKKGSGAKQWVLSRQNSAIMILSANKEVLFFKEGALSIQEIDSALNIIQKQIKQLTTTQPPAIAKQAALQAL